MTNGRRRLPIAAIAGLLAVLAMPGGGLAEGWTFGWKEGFRLESPEGDLKLQFGGRAQVDWTFASGDAALEARVGDLQDGNEIRRARLFFAGTLYGDVEFKVQYDFAGGDAEIRDVYIGLRETPVGGLRFGNFKEPFSLAELTGSKYIAFLERPLPIVFAPGRNVGVMVHDHRGDVLNWALGIFRESDDFGNSLGDDLTNVTGRVAYRPLYREEGRRMVHLGLAGTTKDTAGFSDEFRLRGRPEIHFGPRFVDTGRLAVEGMEVWDLELAGVFGPFWLSGELTRADLADVVRDGDPLGDLAFDGSYLQAGYYLTGEHRRFKTSSGAFDRQRPRHNFGKDGKGAWEVAARFSTLKLADGGLDGGEIDSLSLALNWYLNPVTRLMLNYVRSELSGGGEADFFLVRWQVDF